MEVDMESIEFKSDHDIIVMMATELKQVRIDVRDLKDGTFAKISDHDHRIEALETWRAAQVVSLATQTQLLRTLIALGILILGMIVWHITGYHL
jgi:hypothetical protein